MNKMKQFHNQTSANKLFNEFIFQRKNALSSLILFTSFSWPFQLQSCNFSFENNRNGKKDFKQKYLVIPRESLPRIWSSGTYSITQS